MKKLCQDCNKQTKYLNDVECPDALEKLNVKKIVTICPYCYSLRCIKALETKKPQ